ncbi:SagB family peptide dehydrogenase [Bacillus sp. EB600]|uniref:SagB family peptide dehydrogenase n=1 Tax=Bacillus sp. EB600 TaxID=2806345 RepID=UPI00210CFEC1|nr:SagB family peptide dehydrogenase [Bacillus sp. EB600]MCQ6277687.1 SagB family peptide dehydrogenase [Bacillus sp. EB600]
MDFETFLDHLHFDPEKILPQDWKVDWDDAPLPYKLYRDLQEFTLPSELPLSIEGQNTTDLPKLENIGHFLWYVYGLTQYSQTAFPSMPPETNIKVAQSFRRFVPSGGALYPNELYVYLKLSEIPEGVYHYSTLHHRLVLIREGNFDSYLERSIGKTCNISNCFAAVFVSTVFWKNFYKYHNFSYRLQGLDAGVIIGQSLEVAERMGFTTKVCYQFLDRPVNHLLGLSEQDESVYAVIPLSTQSIIQLEDEEKSFSAASLCQELPERKAEIYQRSKKVIDYPMLRKLNEASMNESTDSFVKLEHGKHSNIYSSIETIMLPYTEPITYDFASVCRERHSPDFDFRLGKVNQTQISTLLKEALSVVYRNDLEEADWNADLHVVLYGCFYNVEGIPNGAYSYEKNAHAIRKISAGDYRGYLQSGLTMNTVNLFQVPLCFHIVGDKDHLIKRMGYRGYRIQQMEAGILVQRLLLTAGALGMGGHPLLGFDPKSCDELYQIDLKEKTSLIQLPVGPYRPRAWLKGGLH